MGIYLLRWILILFLLAACSGSDSTQPCSEVDPTCKREAKATFRIVDGQTTYIENAKVAVDADGSVYDEMIWYLNGNAIPSCKNEEICSFFVNAQGIYEIKLKTKVGGTGQIFLGLAGSPADSEDEKVVNIAVLPEATIAAEASSSTTTATSDAGCSKGVNDDMILIQDSTVCVAMKKTDDYPCRSSDTYTNCADLTVAATACVNDTTNGHEWELPDEGQVKLMYENRGSSGIISGNGFCMDTTAECAPDSTNSPYNYIYSRNGVTSDWDFVSNVHSSILGGGYPRSLRCVTEFDPQ